MNGPGTFLPKLLDQMYNIDFNTYQQQVKRQERLNNMFNSSSLNVYFICGTQDVPEGKDIREILKQAFRSWNYPFSIP